MHICPVCWREVDTVVRENVPETYIVKGVECKINATIRYCKSCGTDLFDETLDSENLVKIQEAYNAASQNMSISNECDS
jgi:hypothetical protein